MPMLDGIGTYALVHPEFVPFGETCYITTQPFLEEHTMPSPCILGHLDVWNLIIPLGPVMVNPVDLSIRIDKVPHLSFFFYADALTLEPNEHLVERIVEAKLKLIARSY